MSDEERIQKDLVFKKAFWEWFDCLSRKEKERFWIFPLDFACLYFYNKIYRHRPKETNA